MNVTRAKGLCAVAVFVVLGACAASASAESPEFQVANKRTGKFEPIKMAVPYAEAGEAMLMSTDTGVKLRCAASSGKGRLNGPKTLSLVRTYTGCEAPDGTTCQSGKTAGEIKSAKLAGALVTAMKGSVAVTAVELGAASGTKVLKYKCGRTKVLVTGHVLGEIGPLERPTTELTETFAEGPETEPGCGTQEIQLVEGMTGCMHLEAEPEPEEEKKPTSTKTSTKKELPPGHVTLIK